MVGWFLLLDFVCVQTFYKALFVVENRYLSILSLVYLWCLCSKCGAASIKSIDILPVGNNHWANMDCHTMTADGGGKRWVISSRNNSGSWQQSQFKQGTNNRRFPIGVSLYVVLEERNLSVNGRFEMLYLSLNTITFLGPNEPKFGTFIVKILIDETQ